MTKRVISSYEKQRLSNVKSNASKMEAMGLGSQTYKAILSSSANRIVEVEENDSEEIDSEEDMFLDDEDYQPYATECEDNMHTEPPLALAAKVSRDETNSSTKRVKQQLRQTGSMVELAETRNQKRLSQLQQQQPPQKVQQQSRVQPPPQKCQHKPREQPAELNFFSQKALPNKPQLVSSKHISKSQPQRQQQNMEKVLESTQRVKEKQLKRKKLDRSQYCPPGSSNVYKIMRQMQKQRTARCNPTSDLPSTLLIQDEAQENMLDITHQDQFVQGSSSSTIPLKVPVDNQNEIRTEVENEDSTPKVAEKKSIVDQH